jgi:dihydrolipoamide dehydrogenase
MKSLAVDVAIIGSGTAGMSAFRAAREHTKNVVVIESGPYGTTCARVGCMPSKLLIAAAEAAYRAHEAPIFGVHPGPVRIDGAGVMERVRSERDRFVGFVLETVAEWPAEAKLHGRARFIAPGKLRVGDDIEIDAARVVIATGSMPFIPPGWREKLGDRLVINDDVFDWSTLPQSVCVVGGGVIALELAQALHRLGVRVKVLARKNRLGPLTDPDLAAKTFEIMSSELTVSGDADDIRVERVSSTDSEREQTEVKWWDGGIEHCDRFDYVLAAMGRRPQIDALDLAAGGIDLGVSGIPHFDRTTGQIDDTAVFIAGDVTNVHPLLHEAADDGRIAGDNAGRYPDVRVHPRRAPLAVVFTDPQQMVAGSSYRVLCNTQVEFAIGEASFDDQGRSRVMAQNRGLVHVYGAHHTGEFLGAEMIGPAAEHIGHLLSWAVQNKMTVQEMLDSPFYHPVVEEGVRTALRDLNRKLKLGPPPVKRSMDCGPGA